MRLRMLAAVLAAVALLSNCGGGSSSPIAPPGTTTQAFAVYNMGDAPADRIVSFEITVNSIVLTNSAGGTVTVLSTPTRIEMMHRNGKFEPLIVGSIPSGTYTSATLTVASPELVYINDLGQPVELEGAAITLTSTTANPAFSPQFTVGEAAMVVNFDFDVGASVALNTGAGTATVTPTFRVSGGPPATSNQDDDDGEIEDIVGVVSSVAAPQFTITVQQSASLTFTTDTSTEFEGVAGVTGLTNGMVVEVEAVTRNDALLATEVEVKPEAEMGMEMEGFVASVSRDGLSQVTSFELVVQDRACANCSNMPNPGDVITVNVDDNTGFRTDDDISLDGLAFAGFSRTQMFAGQQVEVETAMGGMMSGMVADHLELKDQGMVGTISSAPASLGDDVVFDLQLSADSALALLLGSDTVTVYRRPATELDDVTVALGNRVRVRGLLFNDGGTYKVVAVKIRAPE